MLHDIKEVTAIDQDCFAVSTPQTKEETNDLLSHHILVDEIPRYLTSTFSCWGLWQLLLFMSCAVAN